VLAELASSAAANARDELTLAVERVTEIEPCAAAEGTPLWAPPGVVCRYMPDQLPNIALRTNWPADELAVLLCGSLLPAVLASRGALVLRGSAVLGPTGAILLVGPAMAGKSTAAAALAVAGWPVLSDDALVIWPGAHGPELALGPRWIKLWPASTHYGRALGRSLGAVRAGLAKLRYALADPALPTSAGRVGVPVARVCLLREGAQAVTTAAPIASAPLLEMVGTLQRAPGAALASAGMADQFRTLCALARLPDPLLLTRPGATMLDEDYGMTLKALLEAP
jgi:hypothetical protein